MNEKYTSSSEPANQEKPLSLKQIRSHIKKFKQRLFELKSEKYTAAINEEMADLESKIKALELSERNHDGKEDNKKAANIFRKGINKRKARINDLNKARTVGNLATYYHSDSNYEELANEEVIRLEKEIHDLENKIRMIEGDSVPAKDDEVVPQEGERKTTLADELNRIEEEKKKEAEDTADEKEEPKDEPKEEPKKGKKVLGIIQTDLVEKRAKEISAERMTRNKGELRGISGFFKKIWTHNWMAEYYRAREIDRVREELNDAKSTLGAHDVGAEGDKRIKNAIIARFLENAPGLVHEAAGEMKSDVDLEITPEQRTAAEQSIKDAILAYIHNTDVDIAEGNLTEAINRVYMELYFEGGDRKSNGFEPLNIADNIKEYAHEMRGQVEHGTSVAELDLDFELTFGKAVTGARTEEAYTWRDRLIEKMSRSPIGRFVNETTIAAAVCATISAGNFLRGASMRVAGLGILGGLGLGGGLAAMRESQAIKRDRAEHARAMAEGRTFNPENSSRRKEVHETTYNMLPVRQTIDDLRAMTRSNEGVSVPNMTEEQVFNLISLVGCVDSRIALSDCEKIDLLSYSNARDFEVERTELDIELAKAKVAAREAFEKLGLVGSLGDFDSYLDCQTAAQRVGLVQGEGGIESKNKTFDALKKRRVRGAFVKGVMVAGVVGYVFREAIEGVKAGQEWVAGSSANGGQPEFSVHKVAGLLDGLPNTPGENVSLPGAEDVHMTVINGVPHEVTNAIGGVLKVPEGFHVVPGANPHEYQIFAGGHYDDAGNLVDAKLVADHVAFDTGTSGNPGSYELTQNSVEALKKAGVMVGSNSETVSSTESYTTQETQMLTPQQYAAAHPEQFREINRLGWGDNGTVKPDLNELKLQDPVLGRDGKIHISIRGMTQAGSTMGSQRIDVPALVKGGKMECWMSASSDSQFTPARVSFGPDGVAIIDPNSPAGKMFKFDSSGQLISGPRFTEAAAIMGSEQGVPKGIVCATDEFLKPQALIADSHTVTGSKDLVYTKVTTELSYTPPPSEIVPIVPKVIDEVTKEPRWFVPIPFFAPRSPLERLSRDRVQPFGFGDYGLSGSGGAKDKKDYYRKLSKTLKEDPNSKVDDFKETEIYLRSQTAEQGKIIDELVSQVKPMKPECRLSVCIPVAGHQEGKIIYKTLENYLDQDADFNSFEIALFVNTPETDDKGKTIVPDETASEISRFMTDHPEMNIVVMNKTIPFENARIGYVRKALNDAVLKRHHNRGAGVPELIMVSNDADNKGVAVEYISNFIDKMNRHPEVDSFAGQIDWDPESYARNPLVHIGTRLFQYVGAQHRSTSKIAFESSGANFAFRSGIYAAVGGYRPEVRAGEDSYLGAAIRAARENSTSHISTAYAGARVSRLFTSSRRAEKALKDGLSPVEQWDKGFSAFDDEVRKVNWESISKGVDFEKPEDVEALTKELEKVINRTIKRMGGSGENAQFKRALRWLGIKYKSVAGGIEITDNKWLIKGLKDYNKDVRKILEAKTKKRTKNKKTKPISPEVSKEVLPGQSAA